MFWPTRGLTPDDIAARDRPVFCRRCGLQDKNCICQKLPKPCCRRRSGTTGRILLASPWQQARTVRQGKRRAVPPREPCRVCADGEMSGVVAHLCEIHPGWCCTERRHVCDAGSEGERSRSLICCTRERTQSGCEALRSRLAPSRVSNPPNSFLNPREKCPRRVLRSFSFSLTSHAT